MSSAPSLPAFRCASCNGVVFRLFSEDAASTIFVECDNCKRTSRIAPMATLVADPPEALVVS
jgi:hypothetical protein